MLRLKNALAARGMTAKSCAEILGITEKSLYNKMIGATDFSYREACMIKNILPEYDLGYLLSPAPEEVSTNEADAG